MRPILDTQYPFGLPATATVTFIKVPTTSATITVNGTVFTYGTSFSGRGFNPADVAEAFAAAINGDPGGYGSTHNKLNPLTAVFAVYFGNVVTLMARVPGTGGNALTLTTNQAGSITVSGSTFSDGTGTGAGGTGGAGTIVAQQGAANLALSRVTTTGTAATALIARATRRGALVRNTGSNICYLGPATVTIGNGFPLYAGESLPLSWVGLWQVIDDASNHTTLAIADEYD